MNSKALTLEERVKHIEWTLVSFILFIVSYNALVNPEIIPSYYGNYGITIYLAIFLVSLTILIWHIVFVTSSVVFDTSERTANFVENNRKPVFIALIFLIAVLGIYAFKLTMDQFDLSSKEIAQAVLAGLPLLAVANAKKVAVWMRKHLSETKT
ncbi:hypothetical protein J2755_000991 [Methanohalophilus levihalophilus]|uniref:hypothetical protein n=1 Tax=Methanohalophilus levihalophilus TaxID=1431282 RepID=UPI001AE3E7DC|nr:hypothetical protein [Methanohalophilus levihalophilus]MBP2030057.1 hypothetical protein [Methanohalophilus levihalophilus]